MTENRPWERNIKRLVRDWALTVLQRYSKWFYESRTRFVFAMIRIVGFHFGTTVHVRPVQLQLKLWPFNHVQLQPPACVLTAYRHVELVEIEIWKPIMITWALALRTYLLPCLCDHLSGSNCWTRVNWSLRPTNTCDLKHSVGFYTSHSENCSYSNSFLITTMPH